MTEDNENSKSKKEPTAREIAESMAANLRENRKDPDAFWDEHHRNSEEAAEKVRKKTGFKPLSLADLDDDEDF